MIVTTFYLRLVRRISWLVAAGYFLLIPLQAASGFFEIQRLDLRERSEIRATAEVLDRIAQAKSAEQLKAVMLSVPALAQQLSAQPDALDDFVVARNNIVRNGRANLNELTPSVKQKSVARFRRFILLLLMNTTVSAFYGWAFLSAASQLQWMRPMPPSFQAP